MGNKLIGRYRSMPIQVRASVWFLLCSFMQKGISTLTTPIFTRLLSTTEYGQYNVFNSWLSIVTIFVTLHLYSGVYTQGLVKFSDERNQFSSSLQGLTTVMVAAWTVIYLAFHNFWNNLFSLTTAQMLCMLVMIWATAAWSFWAAEQRVKLKYVTLVVVTIIISLAKPLVGILFVTHSDDKVTARIFGLMLVEVVGYVGLYISQMRRGKKFFSKKFWKYALLFNLPLVPHYLSQTVLSSSDRIMISNLIGDTQAGIYSLAYSISLIMTLFNTALSQTLSPWIYQKIKDRKEKDIANIAYGSLALIAFVNLLLMALAPEIIAIFAPSSYAEAVWIIPPVAMSVFFMFSYDLFAKFEFYYEKTNFIMVASIIGAILNIVLNLVFVPMFGYMAAGYTTLFCYIVYALAHYIFMNRVCKKNMDGAKPYNGKILLGLSAGFVLLGFYFLATYTNTIWRYASLAVMLILCIIFRKKIIAIIKSILAARKKKSVPATEEKD